ncbi:hypothetical protein [Actinoplanes auranticolor]|uniref:Uncharacterized protein n=1 Tax=Actinoplanes auranticolor TaxID=47988 RepID=A0A919SAC4_9ACTN|nr:hypothetical protein [Actinoplanes auranticolor]GIM67789.1 hypothetical protein Aau02nite_28880 [Actinoplanes auranticolor]
MTTTTTTPAPTAAETVAAALAAHADGITTRALSESAGVSPSSVAKALAAMEAAGTATRTPGPANGNRKPADIWHPVTATPAGPADETPADDSPADETPADDSPADETPADATPADDSPADDSPADETPADATPADDSPADTAAKVAPVSGAPVGPRQPDLRVLIMAGVLGGHPDGITADAAINESGLSVAMGDTVLAAMEAAGAARRLPTAEDGTEFWVVVADADLATVDPANAPTTSTCPTCGHTRKIRRPSARRTTGTGTGRTTGEINSDGSAKLAKNGLRNQVEAFMRDLGTGHDVTPGIVARQLGGRSSGAVGNAMARLTEPGVLVLVSEAPVKYALAETAPEPTADVVAFMTRPLTDDAPDEADSTDDTDAADAADTADTAETAETADAADDSTDDGAADDTRADAKTDAVPVAA